MSTKKLGRQIYDDEGHSMALGGSRSSVWINRQPLGMVVETGRKELNKADRSQTKGLVNRQWDEPLPAAREVEAPSPTDMQVEKVTERSPMRRHSPRGFVINRAPKVKLGGGGKQKLMTPTKVKDVLDLL
ncbi:unnamed protein product [Linum trigynum]|uniref:Uncharacterized protein n=1 Tax=Linum trigynum TaxID=586398 RepID=A0AAV2FBX7_9ROSI